MNILIDSWSSQVLFQQAPPGTPPNYPVGGYSQPTVTGQRLNTVLGAIKSYGLALGNEWNLTFTDPPITSAQLDNINVYISFTREINIPSPPGTIPTGTGYAYTQAELDLLTTFVLGGGGILLMTDHGQTNSIPNWTANDAKLASAFGVTLQNIFVSNGPPEYMVMNMNTELPSPQNFLASQVSAVAAHDSCIITPPASPAPFFSLLEFPSDATASNYTVDPPTTGQCPPTPYFAILVPYPVSSPVGNVIVVGNSGTQGDYGSPLPAPGMVSLENNLMFFLNCVAYLGGLNCIPVPGQGPCQ